MISRRLLLAALLVAACGDDDGGAGDGGGPDAAGPDAAGPDAAVGELFPYYCTLDIDSDLDGEPDERWTTSQEGMVRTIEADTGIDGSIEVSYEQHYDQDGLILESFQYFPPPTLVRHEVFTRDPDGLRSTWSADTIIGEPFEWRFTTYYDQPQVVDRVERDQPIGGPIEMVERYFYTAGLLDHIDGDLGADDVVDWRSENSYDGDGYLVRFEYDADASGDPEEITLYQVDSAGRKLREEYDSDADGDPERITGYSYDPAGNLLVTEFDNDADGEVDQRQTRSYDCFAE